MNFYLVPLKKLTWDEYLEREEIGDCAIECFDRAQLMPEKAFLIQQAKSPEDAAFLVHFERTGICGDHSDYRVSSDSVIELPGYFLDYIEKSDDCILELYIRNYFFVQWVHLLSYLLS